MERNPDLEAYRDRDDVEFVELTRTVDREESRESIESLDSHVVVGVNDESGDVLLVDDGHHGWTLPAFAFETGENCVAIARSGVEDLLCVDVDIQNPERVRRIEYLVDDDPKVSIYNVVLRAGTVSSDDVPANTAENVDDLEAAGWFDEIPAEAPEGVADDARLFLD